jgi:general secretion pathway protein D
MLTLNPYSSMKSNFKLTFAAAMAAGVFAGPALQAQVTSINPGTSAITFTTQPVETGPILDVVPYVLSDGYTINLALIPSLTDFNGYDTPPNIPSVTGNLNVVQLPVILPDFTVRQVVTTVNVWDNQTVVIGGLISSQVQDTKDKVPGIGDVPLIGRLFQSSSKDAVKKNLMIFVTATIVDPAGNRVHSDDDLPFAQSAIPTQPEGAGQVSETVRTTHELPAENPPAQSP